MRQNQPEFEKGRLDVSSYETPTEVSALGEMWTVFGLFLYIALKLDVGFWEAVGVNNAREKSGDYGEGVRRTRRCRRSVAWWALSDTPRRRVSWVGMGVHVALTAPASRPSSTGLFYSPCETALDVVFLIFLFSCAWVPGGKSFFKMAASMCQDAGGSYVPSCHHDYDDKCQFVWSESGDLSTHSGYRQCGEIV